MVFSMSSKQHVMILLPLLFLRSFCLLSFQTCQSHKITLYAVFTLILYQMHFSDNAEGARKGWGGVSEGQGHWPNGSHYCLRSLPLVVKLFQVSVRPVSAPGSGLAHVLDLLDGS